MYDYVIVGGGSAGCVLAARLSEDPEVQVLLVEAGPSDDEENIRVPAGFMKLAPDRFDWEYESAPERTCLDRRIALPRGKVLGGSSSTNAMIYVRGNPRDYDEWGVAGWAWQDLLPCFLRAEDDERGASPWHGAGGPLAVSHPRAVGPGVQAFLAATAQAGIAQNEDFNGAGQDGAGLFQLTQRDGRRASAADCYLRPALSRPNLTVLVGTRVTGIVFDGARALGVRANAAEGEQELLARREVILAAGAYNSPQLLMLSGIGPSAHLEEHGIPPLLDRPAVGENLSDHAATEVLWMGREPDDRDARRRWRSTKLMLAAQRGPFAAGLAEAGAFARVGAGAPAPDVQLHFVAVGFVDETVGDSGEAHGAWISPCLLTPHSRGTVRLASADPLAKPMIRNDFYTQEGDLERLVQGLRLAMRIGAQPALAEYCANPFTTPEDDSDAALRDHLARTTFAFYHPVGTCRMGDDEQAVVDGRLRVRGAEGLRVIDASVMPSVPRGNTNGPTIALAERAAELIRGEGSPAR